MFYVSYCSTAFALLKALPLRCHSLPVPEALIDSCPRLPSPGPSFWPPQEEHIGQWHLPQQLCPAMRAECITSTFWSNFSLKLTLTVTVNVCHQLWTLLVTVSASFLPCHVSEILWLKYYDSLKSLLPRLWVLLNVMGLCGEIFASNIVLLTFWKNKLTKSFPSPTHITFTFWAHTVWFKIILQASLKAT